MKPKKKPPSKGGGQPASSSSSRTRRSNKKTKPAEKVTKKIVEEDANEDFPPEDKTSVETELKGKKDDPIKVLEKLSDNDVLELIKEVEEHFNLKLGSEESSDEKNKEDTTDEGKAQQKPEKEGTSEKQQGVCAFCGKEAESKCMGCHLVFYCARECQRKDWKGHKDTCRPYMISKEKELGRHLTASRDLLSDDVIIEEFPIVIGPRQGGEPVCLACYKRVYGEYRCSRCSWPLCSMDCENSKHHQPECDVTSTAGIYIKIDSFEEPAPIYDVITPLRCLLFAAKNPKRWRAAAERYNVRSSEADLKDHHNYEFIVNVLQRSFSIESHAGIFGSEASIYCVSLLLQLNNIPTKTSYTEVQGLYPIGSLASNSCCPNTKIEWRDDYRLKMTTTEPIKRGDPITTIYTDILWGTKARRTCLEETRLFSCSCRRCVDATELGTFFSALRCNKCSKNSPVISTNPLDNSAPWSCISCGSEANAEKVMETTFTLGAAVTDALREPSVESLESLLKEWSDVVHKNHYHLHAVKHSLLQLYGRDKEISASKDAEYWIELNKKEKVCKEFLTVCSRLDSSMGYTNQHIGLTFYEYHKTIIQMAKRNYGLARIDEQQLKKRMLLAKALLRKTMDIFKKYAKDTSEGQLYSTCQKEILSIDDWMSAVGLT